MGYPQNNDNTGLLLNVISILLAQENLVENRQQSYQNNVQRANDEQARYLLDEIKSNFASQKEILLHLTTKINRINEKLEKIEAKVGQQE